VVEQLKKMLSDYYWTDDELVRAGRYIRYENCGARRKKIPEELRDIAARNRVNRKGHKKLAPGRKVPIKKNRSTMLFKKSYGLSYLRFRYRLHRL